MSNTRCPICETSIHNCECEKRSCLVCNEELTSKNVAGVTHSPHPDIVNCDVHCDCLYCGGSIEKETVWLDDPRFCSEDCAYSHDDDSSSCEHDWQGVEGLQIELDLDDNADIKDVRFIGSDEWWCSDCDAHGHFKIKQSSPQTFTVRVDICCGIT